MANGPSPTVEEIQLRKRARRRLIGAITLVALMVTVLPMVLDDEPKPMGQDIAISIPSQQGNDFPLQAAKPSQQTPVPALQPQPAVAPKPEVHASPAPVAPPSGVTEAKPDLEAPGKTEKPAHKTEKSREAAPAPKAAKPAPKEDKKPAPKEDKPAPKEDKPAPKAVETQHSGNAYIVMLGAFLSEANAKQRQAKLKDLGVKYYLEKIKSPAGVKTGVRAGPFSTRQEAEHALARLKAAGIADGLVTEQR